MSCVFTFSYLKIEIYLYVVIQETFDKMVGDQGVFDRMVGRPRKENSKSKSFAMYEKTWLILKELEHVHLQTTSKNKPLKQIAHDAIEEYYNREKKKSGKDKGRNK